MKKIYILGILAVLLVSGCVSSPLGSNPMNQISIGLPKSDVSGSDIPGTRYANSIRFEYNEYDCEKDISYYTTDSFQNVVQFYKNLEGWTLESQRNEAGPTVNIPNVGSFGSVETTSLDLSRGDEYLTVDINHIRFNKKDYVIIDLTYTESCGEEEASTETENEYDAASDVPVLAGAQELDSLVRPVLRDVFGGAKAVNSAHFSGLASIDYIVKRPITLDDVTTIANRITSMGYELTSQGVDESNFELSFSQNGIPKLGVSGDIGFQKITATMIEE